jgi:hypothetical protein
VLVVEISGVEKFAVDIELQLVICAVADARRFGSRTVEVIGRLLDQMLRFPP